MSNKNSIELAKARQALSDLAADVFGDHYGYQFTGPINWDQYAENMLTCLSHTVMSENQAKELESISKKLGIKPREFPVTADFC